MKNKNVLKKLGKFYIKKGGIIRFTFILLLAIFINFQIFPDLKIPSNNVEKIFEENNMTFLDLKGSFDLNEDELSSESLDKIFWKIVYLGSVKDRICFEKKEKFENQSFYGSYNQGEFYEIIGKKCFKIPKDEEKITFNVKYEFHLTIPNMESLPPVNKSDCLPGTINEKDYTCMTQQGIDNKVSMVLYPHGEVYLEANLFHKIIKLIFIFFSTGALIWAFSRTFYLIKYGWDKNN